MRGRSGEEGGAEESSFATMLGVSKAVRIDSEVAGTSALETTIRLAMTRASAMRGGTEKVAEESPRPVRRLGWREATGKALVREVEQIYAARSLCLPVTPVEAETANRSAKAFRWTLRVAEEELYFAKIEGDVSAVYPGLTNEDLRADPAAFARFFSVETIEEMGRFLNGVLNGGVEKRALGGPWHSLPEHDIIIEIELFDVVRYYDSTGKATCIETGETRLITESIRTYGSIIAKIISEHRETADHRLGNKLRLMHLLCQEGKLSELNDAFERVGHEIAIRRKFFDDLPPIEPVSAATFVTQEFLQTDVAIDGCEPTARLLFRDGAGRPLSPIVLQVLILQDCASNVFKHGTGSARVAFSPAGFVISNSVGVKAARTPSRRLGLETLRHVASELHTAIDIDVVDDVFSVTVAVGITFLPPPAPLDDAALVAASESAAALSVSDFKWLVVDDEPLICKRFQNVAKSHFGVPVTVVTSPADIANIVRIVANAVKLNPPARATLVIYDEQLRELDDEFNLVAVTGTTLRDRVHAALATHLKDASLFSVSASASVVHDPRCLLRLGKTGSVARDMTAILQALRHALSAPP